MPDGSPRYLVTKSCMVRAGLELDSERRGICQAGQVVVALQEQQCADGTVRVQIDRGWVSKAAKG
eukprot:COSAG05_NODE_6706_length_917_cov_4.603912_1_plen_64_part_10